MLGLKDGHDSSIASRSNFPRSRICLLMDRLRAKFGQPLCTVIGAKADGGRGLWIGRFLYCFF